MTDSLHDEKVKTNLIEKQEKLFRTQFWEERKREDKKMAQI